jgi:hypothetical protein
MSDEFERLLKHVPEAVPPPDPILTSRIREALLEAFRPTRRESLRRSLLLAAAALLIGGTGFGAGRWTSPSSAASDLTIGARPDTISLKELKRPVLLFGTIPSGLPGQSVQIEANECGLSGSYHELEGVRTEGHGVWSLPIPGSLPQSKVNDYIHTKTSYRARWNNRLSDEVTVFVRSYVDFHQLPVKPKKGKRLFGIGPFGRQMKYKPRVILERRTATGWTPAATLVMSGAGSPVRWLRAAKGQVLRVRLPDAEAAPCYLGSVSSPVRVR